MPTMENMYRGEGVQPHGAMDRCAGCSATGVSLLACDDIDGKGTAIDPGRREKFCANCMIGKNVRVFWPVDNSWYIGTVEQYDGSSGEHLLRYEDNDTEWVKIGESNTTAPPPTSIRGGPPPGRISSPHEIDPIPPVSPAGHVAPQRGEPQQTQSAYSGEQQQQQNSVTPDHKWQQGESRRPGPSPYHHHYQGGAPGGAPGMYSHQHMGPYPPPPQAGYPGYGPPPPGGPYGYPPPIMGMPPHPHSAEALKSRAQQSPSPTSSLNGKRKSGPKAWTKEEDALLLNIVQSMRMPMKWSVVAQSLPDRTGKQCRERYVNHLNPRLKITDWSPLEDATIFHLYNTIGSHWAKMSKIIPGRTDNGIKNRFHNLRRQLEREDEHRLRLSTARDFPDEIRLDRIRELPQELRGKAAELWDMKSGLSVLAAQSVLGGSMSRNAGRFGPFRVAEENEACVRCGFFIPSVHTGSEVCSKTGWCQSCTRIPPHVSGNMLRECLNLRRCQDDDQRKVIESWEDPAFTADQKAATKEATAST